MSQKEIQTVEFEENKSTRKCNEAKYSLEEIKMPKESLMLNGIKAVVASGEDPTQLSCQFVKRD